MTRVVVLQAPGPIEASAAPAGTPSASESAAAPPASAPPPTASLPYSPFVVVKGGQCGGTLGFCSQLGSEQCKDGAVSPHAAFSLCIGASCSVYALGHVAPACNMHVSILHVLCLLCLLHMHSCHWYSLHFSPPVFVPLGEIVNYCLHVADEHSCHLSAEAPPGTRSSI
jgi:hypothetical protein